VLRHTVMIWCMGSLSTFGLTDLAREADVTPRTVRYYIGQGLLPGPVGQGPAAQYSRSHVDRLRVIKRLQLQHLPLAEIRSRLEELDENEIARLADEVEPAIGNDPDAAPAQSALAYIRGVLGERAPARQSAPASARYLAVPPMASRVREPTTDYLMKPTLPKPRPTGSDRSTWERISLAPDIELHVRRPLDRQSIKQLDQLLDAARELFRDT
jgi:DNA-binding transcriptional MerR regulator